MKLKLKVNSLSIETESENGIFLFIPFTPCATKGYTFDPRASMSYLGFLIPDSFYNPGISGFPYFKSRDPGIPLIYDDSCLSSIS